MISGNGRIDNLGMLKQINFMKNKERIAILEAEISRLKVANRNTNERLEAIEGKLGIEVPECVANNGVSCEPSGDAILRAENEILALFGEMKSGEAKQVNRENIANEMAKIMADVQNAVEPITPDFIPDWKDAPEDAVCVAMDGNGDWFWWRHKPTSDLNEKGKWNTMSVLKDGFENGLTEIGWFADSATNADLLPPDYWKSTLMMRPESISDAPDYTHLLPDGYEFCEEGEHDDWVKVKIIPSDDYAKKIEIGSLLMGKFCWDKFKPYYRPIRKSSLDYSHLLPDGYEFCSEQDAEKWVKVEILGLDAEADLGEVKSSTINMIDGRIKSYRPIRPIQYKVTTHEIVTAVPDPYMPDWSKAPEWVYVHAFDFEGNGHWYGVKLYGNERYLEGLTSPFTLPPDLDWRQSLRVKPN
jgi:hypothetical protein